MGSTEGYSTKEGEGHQRPDPSLHDQSFGNCCFLSFLQILSDDAFFLFHSPHLPPYAHVDHSSDISRQAADFYLSETTTSPCSLFLKTSCLSPVLFHLILLKLRMYFQHRLLFVHCCISSLGGSSWASHLPLRNAIYKHFYAGQVWQEYSSVLLNCIRRVMSTMHLFCFVPHLVICGVRY